MAKKKRNNEHMLNEDQAKKVLNTKSFETMPKNKIGEFVALLPRIKKDVAVAIINQFPSYADYASGIVETLKQIYNNSLQYNDKSHSSAIEAYNKVLDSLREEVLRDDLTYEQKMLLNEKMIEVADKISAKDTENKKWLKEMFTTGAKYLAPAVPAVAIVVTSIFKFIEHKEIQNAESIDNGNNDDGRIIDAEYSINERDDENDVEE